jgi:beta-glucosidase
LDALRATNIPLVVVMTSGSALAVPDVHQYAAAMLHAWYPGAEGGTAIAETLAGDNNPSGRLPLTFYASLDQLPRFEEYSMANRTYRYFTGKPLFGFGFGLSYTQFAYSRLALPTQPVKAGQPVTVGVDVKNVGSRGGDEVVQVYLSQPKRALTPLRTLAGFKRVHLEPGQTAHVDVAVSPRTLGQVNEKGDRVITEGSYAIAVGGSQPGDIPGGASGTFNVAGSVTLPR